MVELGENLADDSCFFCNGKQGTKVSFNGRCSHNFETCTCNSYVAIELNWFTISWYTLTGKK